MFLPDFLVPSKGRFDTSAIHVFYSYRFWVLVSDICRAFVLMQAFENGHVYETKVKHMGKVKGMRLMEIKGVFSQQFENYLNEN